MTIEFLSLAELLKLYRERRNLNQRQFAAQLNLDSSLVSRWENQLRVPNLDHFRQVALILGLREEQAQNLIDARDNVVAEVLVLHELLSLYLFRTQLTDTQLLERLDAVNREKLQAWRRGSRIPTNPELIALAQALSFDREQSSKLLSARPRLVLSAAVLSFILLGSGQVTENQVAELINKGVEIVAQA